MANITMTWADEIRILGNDFLIPKKVIDNIIRDTRRLYPGRGDSYMYDRAWAMLFKYM